MLNRDHAGSLLAIHSYTTKLSVQGPNFQEKPLKHDGLEWNWTDQ